MAYDEAAGPSSSAELTAATATTGASYEVHGVMFNHKNHGYWSEARITHRQLVNRHKDDCGGAK
jgi:hypothetical protein